MSGIADINDVEHSAAGSVAGDTSRLKDWFLSQNVYVAFEIEDLAQAPGLSTTIEDDHDSPMAPQPQSNAPQRATALEERTPVPAPHPPAIPPDVLPYEQSTSASGHTATNAASSAAAQAGSPPPPADPSPSGALGTMHEMREKIRNSYVRLRRGQIPLSYRNSAIPSRDRYRGHDSGGLHRETSKLSNDYFTADGDPQHVLARLPELQRIYSDLLETYGAGFSNAGIQNQSTSRTTWDHLLKCIRVPADDTRLSSTTHNCEEKVALSAPAGLKFPSALEGTSRIIKSWPHVAQADVVLYYTPSKRLAEEFSLATQGISATTSAELSWRKKSILRSLTVPILAIEYKLLGLVKNVSQTILVLVTMQRHLHALGITGQVSFGFAAADTTLKILGCATHPGTEKIYVFLCASLDIRHAAHFWESYFFLHNLEAWAREDLEELLKTPSVETRNLPQLVWRSDNWKAPKPTGPKTPSKRRRADDGDDENEGRHGPSRGGDDKGSMKRRKGRTAGSRTDGDAPPGLGSAIGQIMMDQETPDGSLDLTEDEEDQHHWDTDPWVASVNKSNPWTSHDDASPSPTTALLDLIMSQEDEKLPGRSLDDKAEREKVLHWQQNITLVCGSA